MPQRESLEIVHLQGLYHGELGARFGDLKRLKHLDIELAVLFGCGRVPRYDAECYALNKIPISELLPLTLESLTLRYNMLATLAKEQLQTTALHRLLSRMQRLLPSFQKLALLRERKESLTCGCKEISKHDEEVNGLFTSIEGVCRSLTLSWWMRDSTKSSSMSGSVVTNLLLRIACRDILRLVSSPVSQ